MFNIYYITFTVFLLFKLLFKFCPCLAKLAKEKKIVHIHLINGDINLKGGFKSHSVQANPLSRRNQTNTGPLAQYILLHYITISCLLYRLILFFSAT